MAVNVYQAATIAQYTGNANVFSGYNDEYLKSNSLIRVYAVSKDVYPTITVNVGGNVVIDNQNFYTNAATVVTLPNRRDHMLWQGYGRAGDRVIIALRNQLGAISNVAIIYEVIPVR